jgi:hypothetical protein
MGRDEDAYEQIGREWHATSHNYYQTARQLKKPERQNEGDRR